MNLLSAPELPFLSELLGVTAFQLSEIDQIGNEEFSFPTNIMLGKQAEQCFEYYLKHSKRYNLVAANIQIQGLTHTIGELDYLVYDLQENKALHIELACKFYLYDSSLSSQELKCWTGPNRKDNLFQKLEKLRLKQFPLLYSEEAIVELNHLNLEISSVEQQLCLKSFLFTKRDEGLRNILKDYENAIVGYWITLSEFASEDKLALYRIYNKLEWLLLPENLEEFKSLGEVSTMLELHISNKRSQLVYKRKGNRIERFFVVWW